jgi:hypothetical protein
MLVAAADRGIQKMGRVVARAAVARDALRRKQTRVALERRDRATTVVQETLQRQHLNFTEVVVVEREQMAQMPLARQAEMVGRGSVHQLLVRRLQELVVVGAGVRQPPGAVVLAGAQTASRLAMA